MYTHHQANTLRYAEMKSSMNNKTFNGQSTQSNGVKAGIKSKFTQFEQSLNQLENETRILVQDTHVNLALKQRTLRQCEQMKNTIANDMLEQYRLLCRDEIKNLEKEFIVGKTNSEEKTNELWNGCKAMVQQSEHLKNTVKEIQNRIQRVEVTLGFYNAEEKMNRF